MIAKTHRWQLSALAAAATALIGLSPAPASALSLGAVVVQSALGEPLRAEIDIPEINADEAASLKATVASPEAFRAAGLEYNAAMANTKVTLQRRANGRAYIRLVSDRPVNEPFVDMILEASWASGRIVRDYTMLFDPPNLRAPVAANTENLAQVAPSAAVAPQPAGVIPRTASAAATGSGPAAAVPRPAVAAPKAAPKPAAKAPAPAAAPAPDSAASDKQVTVQPGDTAGKIAMANKSASVSLDQMLVALLRANPNAFINSNINRVKSGAVMNLPTPEQAQSTPASEAHQIVIAQSKDFGEYSKKLAGAAPSAQVGVADRQASGSVQAKVEDKKPASGAPDKLTLSKGALQAQAEAEKLAAEKAAKDSATRAAEVSKNIKDLADINAATGKPGAGGATGATATPTPSPATGVAKPAVPVAPPAPPATVVVPTPPVVAVAPPAPPPAAAVKPASAPVVPPVAGVASAAKPATKPAVIPAPVPAEPGLIDQITENPLLLAGGAGLIALLAGFGLYRVNQRKKSDQVDSSYLESRLQPDSFFGASGGQRVDTQDSAVGGASSMVYTPSQLDAADDVDPVAEADVYLAYGRDVQAEEILKEALKFNAGRVAIHQKLLEIYAKRRDVKSFENAAKEAFKPTGGTGADWHRICDLGLSIDPNNPLYSPGGQPSGYSESTQNTGVTGAGALVGGATAAGALSAFAATASFDTATAPMSAHLDGAAPPVDLSFDLDLDFSLDEENASLMQSLGTGETTSKMQALNTGSAPLDVNIDASELSSGATVPAPMASIPRMEPLDFDMSVAGELSNSGQISRPAPLEGEDFSKQAAVSFGTTIAGTVETFAPKAPESAAPASGFMQFDLGGLSLDLGDPAEKTVIIPPAAIEDPLATKLSLAEEFNAIGDDDGARALIEEVILEATGDMKARAQLALAKLS